MKKYGAFEAKTHFSEILGEVMNGEKCIITKHGVQVAIIIPFSEEGEEINPALKAIRAIKNIRKGKRLGKNLSIRQMREEGRK